MKEKKQCEICGKPFFTYQESKFCSRTCYYSYGRPNRVQSHKDKNRQALLDYYKTSAWQKNKKERGEKISLSNKKYLSLEEIEILKMFLEEKYVYNRRILAKHINKGISYKTLNSTFEKFPELYYLYQQTTTYVPLQFQKLSIDEWNDVKAKFKNQNITEFCENFKINEKTHKRLQFYFKELIPRKYTRKKETKPEQIVRSLLDSLNIKYEQEKQIKEKYIFDFVVQNIVIEVQGDYWHGNPRFYLETNLNSIQSKHIKRDTLKLKTILNLGMSFIELWEYDIYNKTNKVKQLLNLIKHGKFNRSFYTSSSWK